MPHENTGSIPKENPFAGMPPVGGIVDPSIFHPSINKEGRPITHRTVTASGVTLEYEMTDRLFYLYIDPDVPEHPYFEAELFENEDGEFKLSINALTKIQARYGYRTDTKIGKSHPDLPGREMLTAAILYFENIIGKPIRYLEGSWDADSDNYTAFYNYLHTTYGSQASYTEEQLSNAAYHTWTGGEAKFHGFTEAEVTFPWEGSVSVTFKRPSPNESGVMVTATDAAHKIVEE